MMFLGLRDATTPVPNPDVVEEVKVQSVSLGHLLLAGVVTGFAMALGNSLFRHGFKRLSR